MNAAQAEALLAAVDRIEVKLDRLLAGATLAPTAPADPRQVDPKDEPLFEALVEWRREQAAREGVEAYRVFGNSVLAAIARERPVDRYALTQIKGIGAVRCSQYGDAVLAVIANHTW